MSMTISEFVSDPGRMKGYSEWLHNPMTVELLEMARDHVSTAPLKPVTGESALYNYGMVEGAGLVITLLTKMDELVKQHEITKMLAEDPTYGAAKIVKEKYA
jgi:hypothetical protein